MSALTRVHVILPQVKGGQDKANIQDKATTYLKTGSNRVLLRTSLSSLNEKMRLSVSLGTSRPKAISRYSYLRPSRVLLPHYTGEGWCKGLGTVLLA